MPRDAPFSGVTAATPLDAAGTEFKPGILPDDTGVTGPAGGTAGTALGAANGARCGVALKAAGVELEAADAAPGPMGVAAVAATGNEMARNSLVRLPSDGSPPLVICESLSMSSADCEAAAPSSIGRTLPLRVERADAGLC